MAQTTRPTPRTGTGRFARPGAAQTRARRTTPRRTAATRTAPRGRTPQMPARFSRNKPKQKTGIAGTLTGLLPTGAASKATPNTKKGKAGGFAALAAAAGVAFKNRDKLGGMLNRKGGDQRSPSQPTSATTPTPAPTPVEPRDTTPGV
ncbi:MAG TPA: hypothetical protein VKA84_20875 [Gemmatimonadaceae bacterium]|nr:hypothetical protein [Gemmatimonadaceae bacterium]